MAKLDLIDSVAHPYKEVNEDLFDHNDQAAWIFDGASGIGPKIMTHAPSDPYWLVHTFNDALKKNWNDATPTKQLFEKASAAIAEEFLRQAPVVPPAVDRPTACLLMARLGRNRLEVSAVGDCWLVYRSGTNVQEFGNKLGDVAAPVYRELKRLKETGVSGKDLVDRLIPVEREVRAKANTDGGYAILDLTARWINRMAEHVFDARAGDEFLLMTDGFYRLIDIFKAYTAASLIEAARNKGLAALYTELREMEAGDEDCALYPRIKIRDDAAAALLKVS